MQTEPDQGSGHPGRNSATFVLDALDLEGNLPRIVEAHDDHQHCPIASGLSMFRGWVLSSA
jgi:hypothetical protein